MRSFTAKQLVTILQERGVVVSDEVANRCSSLCSCLQEVLLVEQEDGPIKNCPSTSSRGRRETSATKKQKKMYKNVRMNIFSMKIQETNNVAIKMINCNKNL